MRQCNDVNNSQIVDKFWSIQEVISTSLVVDNTCGSTITLNKCSCILHKFVMHVTNKQFSDKFNIDLNNFKMADLLWFIAFYVNNCEEF